MTETAISDEATGLPPLEELGDDETLIVLAWVGGTGIVQSPHSTEDIPVRYLHARGLAVPTEAEKAQGAEATWVQVHLAVPVDHAVDVAAALASGGMLD